MLIQLTIIIPRIIAHNSPHFQFILTFYFFGIFTLGEARPPRPPSGYAPGMAIGAVSNDEESYIGLQPVTKI